MSWARVGLEPSSGWSSTPHSLSFCRVSSTTRLRRGHCAPRPPFERRAGSAPALSCVRLSEYQIAAVVTDSANKGVPEVRDRSCPGSVEGERLSPSRRDQLALLIRDKRQIVER